MHHSGFKPLLLGLHHSIWMYVGFLWSFQLDGTPLSSVPNSKPAQHEHAHEDCCNPAHDGASRQKCQEPGLRSDRRQQPPRLCLDCVISHISVIRWLSVPKKEGLGESVSKVKNGIVPIP
eukprot:TRINITY_DN6322_c0_g4_i3.p1 TRINITY_DN6322_c0_g4~~TRINITY_DN6322_c0_g4_i3.p1  ORF type:complete len:120 (-),score=4.54 TRINITY_DN6322_c0_g4_i3:710-1069(-)